jgi:hypothetical protein
MGFLILKTIYGHWPNNFNLYKNFKTNHANSHHDATPSLLLGEPTLSAEQHTALINLTDPLDVVLVHNISVIPPEIKNQSLLINVECNISELATATFLFFYKCNHFMFNYITSNNRDIPLAQALFNQLKIYNKRVSYDAADVSLNYTGLNNYSNIVDMLTAIQTRFDLGLFDHQPDQYLKGHTSSLAPTILYPQEHAKFCRIFQSAIMNTEINYINALDVEMQKSWEQLTNFFFTLYQKESP